MFQLKPLESITGNFSHQKLKEKKKIPGELWNHCWTPHSMNYTWAGTINALKQHESLHRVDLVCVCLHGCVLLRDGWSVPGLKRGHPVCFVAFGGDGASRASKLYSLLIRSVCHTSSPYLKVWCTTPAPLSYTQTQINQVVLKDNHYLHLSVNDCAL